MPSSKHDSFHNLQDAYSAQTIKEPEPDIDIEKYLRVKWQKPRESTETHLSYSFDNHSHPYVSQLMSLLQRQSVDGLQKADTKNSDFREEFFVDEYVPTKFVGKPYPVKDLDFSPRGGYSVYNWEIFFHIPLTVAIHLSKNQRFEDAQRWFHYVFDPTDSSDGPTPQRFWKVKPFQQTDVQLVQDLLRNLSDAPSDDDTASLLREETINSIGAWKNNPFRPHAVARYRHSAYMFKTVMAYLDNIIAWGDGLFRQDTRETINEATQLYILASFILGPRPQAVPRKRSVRRQTYASFKEDLDEFSNTLVGMENVLSFDTMPHPPEVTQDDRISGLNSIGRSLYFCVPRNDRLLEYWDTVADRLFKIRNSLNLHGIFRQLPLFAPPIDPALLAQAAASGLDVGATIAGLNQPLPLVRFRSLVQSAAEICQDVKSLGASVLSALEKEDNEALAILRSKHERAILEAVEVVRYGQWQEAIKAREALEVSLVNAAQRYTYYERLLGRTTDDIQIPEIEGLDAKTLDKLKLKAREPEVSLRDVPVDIAKDLSREAEGRLISSHEQREMGKMAESQSYQNRAASYSLTGSALSLLPSISFDSMPLGVGAHISFGGLNIASMWTMRADIARARSGLRTYDANKVAKIGGYTRREQEWAFQSNVIAGEMNLLFKQLRGAQIREALAEREWSNHKAQIKNAEEIETFLLDEKKGKRTNRDFYKWMKREAKGLYARSYEFAFELAKKAERAMQHELGDRSKSFIKAGHLSGKEGLFAGEKLYFEIKQMEAAYKDFNKREYELTTNISLRQLEPEALIQLRETGECTLEVPEAMFDLEGPGHFFRRIKSVALSIPAVAGPFVGVNCKLSLTSSEIRIKNTLKEGEYKKSDSDNRFQQFGATLESIVTSSAQQDSGLFQINLDDERYLPFEGYGAISKWRLQLPSNPSAGEPQLFDYDTISDVILHVRYTARDANSDTFRQKVKEYLEQAISEADAVGSARLLSVRHDFADQWARFKASPKDPDGYCPLALPIGEKHLPFWANSSDKKLSVTDVQLISGKNLKVIGRDPVTGDNILDHVSSIKASPDNQGNVVSGSLKEETRKKIYGNDLLLEGPLTLGIDDSDVEDLWIILKWSSSNG